MVDAGKSDWNKVVVVAGSWDGVHVDIAVSRCNGTIVAVGRTDRGSDLPGASDGIAVAERGSERDTVTDNGSEEGDVAISVGGLDGCVVAIPAVTSVGIASEDNCSDGAIETPSALAPKEVESNGRDRGMQHCSSTTGTNRPSSGWDRNASRECTPLS